jgi:hypothetical protein
MRELSGNAFEELIEPSAVVRQQPVLEPIPPRRPL